MFSQLFTAIARSSNNKGNAQKKPQPPTANAVQPPQKMPERGKMASTRLLLDINYSLYQGRTPPPPPPPPPLPTAPQML